MLKVDAANAYAALLFQPLYYMKIRLKKIHLTDYNSLNFFGAVELLVHPRSRLKNDKTDTLFSPGMPAGKCLKTIQPVKNQRTSGYCGLLNWDLKKNEKKSKKSFTG